MKVLVTGSEGYIGTGLAPALADRGHEVVGLDTGFYADGRLYGVRQPPVPCIRKDIRQVLEADLDGFDAVVHLAELSNDPLGERDPAVTYAINHAGSVRLAQLCKRAGIQRFVYSSSCSVYGATSADLVTEESGTNPQTVYARCKLLVERDVSGLADSHFCPTFLRNATAYGSSPSMRFDLVLNNLAGLAWTAGEIRMTSDGTPWRPLVHVLDIAEAVACVLEAPRDTVHGEIFNVGDNAQNYQIVDIASVVAAVFPDCRLTVGDSRGDARSYRVSFDKIHAALPEFKCHRDAVAGAGELRRVFERVRLSSETFRFRTFTRLRQLEHLVQSQQVDGELFWR